MEIKEFIEKFAEAVEIDDAGGLTPATEFRSLEQWGSLATLSMIALADEEFGVELDPDTFKKAKTIEDLYNICSAK